MDPRKLGAFAVLIAVVALSPRAHAYPQWQLSTGAVRCNQCHFAPAGGGLINGYGRDAAGDDLSTFGGSGALLHGAVELPSWLALGGDLRGAYVRRSVQDPGGYQQAVFPMQADLYARVAFGAGVSLSATGGFRGQVRTNDDLIPTQNYQPIDASRFISREHYVMWQPQAQGPYVRAGRFFVPFGLGLAEHIVYVRRDLGFGTLQETYNVSAGWTYDQSSLHVTAFAPDFARHIGGDAWGGAAFYERRVLGDVAAVAAQGRYAKGPDAGRWTGGLVGKLYVAPARTLLFAEANLLHVTVDAGGQANQFVGAAGAALLPVRGVVITLLGERFQDDLAVAQAGWTAATALVSWFPYAHVEAQTMFRLEVPGGGTAVPAFFAQLHYYF